MARKRATMREGPLAELFRKTEAAQRAQDAGPDEPESAVDEFLWCGMAGTNSWMAPRADICGVCMTQRMPGFWHPFSHDFKRMVYEKLG